jgi:hypothetical protein
MAQTQERPAFAAAPFSEKMIGEFRDTWADTLRAEITTFEAESRATIAAMKEGLRAIEGGGVTTSRAGNGHTATTARKRSRPSRARRSTASTGAGPSKNEVLARIRAGNTTAASIAKVLGCSEATAARRLADLQAARAVRKEGQRRATKWLIVGQPGGLATAA